VKSHVCNMFVVVRGRFQFSVAVSLFCVMYASYSEFMVGKCQLGREMSVDCSASEN